MLIYSLHSNAISFGYIAIWKYESVMYGYEERFVNLKDSLESLIHSLTILGTRLEMDPQNAFWVS